MRLIAFLESLRPPASRYGMPSDDLGDAFGPGSRAEDWRAVPGFEHFYEVSDLGNIRSFHFGSPRPKVPGFDKDGYLVVVLYGAGQRRTVRVHRLVAEVFHADKRNALHCEVAHLDNNRANCRAGNLKWVGRVENSSHKRVHGTHQAGERHPRARLTWAVVAAVRASAKKYGDLAAEHGVSCHTISDIKRGRRWNADPYRTVFGDVPRNPFNRGE